MSVINIVPQPYRLARQSGTFPLTADTTILAPGNARRTGLQLASSLAPATGLWLEVKSSSRTRSNCIDLRLDARLKKLGREGYTLLVSPDRVRIRVCGIRERRDP